MHPRTRFVSAARNGFVAPLRRMLSFRHHSEGRLGALSSWRAAREPLQCGTRRPHRSQPQRAFEIQNVSATHVRSHPAKCFSTLSTPGNGPDIPALLQQARNQISPEEAGRIRDSNAHRFPPCSEVLESKASVTRVPIFRTGNFLSQQT
jgi:hypothetical protein